MTADEDLTGNQVDMPAAEVHISVDLVRRLLTDQHPDLATLPIRSLANGWDNVLFRLGDNLVVRLPRRQLSAQLVVHEQRWLPVLAPRLPLPVPVPVRIGRPTNYYPWAWSVQPWLPGSAVGNNGWSDPSKAARDLGQFLAALHSPAPTNRPLNPHRGGPLSKRHKMTVERIQRYSGTAGVAAQQALELWLRCSESEPWSEPPCWIHGDLHLFNIIQHPRIQGGSQLAVIDFGDICGGDPACDLAIGWAGFDPSLHQDFRRAYGEMSEATWLRARGWCLSIGFTFVAFSADMPSHTQMGIRMIRLAMANP